MAIETVAAGGGSICSCQGSRLVVGPESASSDPGPACYGKGGPLAVTDINVYLGRFSETHFPFRLNRQAIEKRMQEVQVQIVQQSGQQLSMDAIANGFWEIANHNMATAIRTVSVSRGYDPQDYLLVAFGGAGPQHALAVANQLNIQRVLIHPRSSVLSAEGIRLADRSATAAQSVLKGVDEPELESELFECLQKLKQQTEHELLSEGVETDAITFRRTVDLRYRGTEPWINVAFETLQEALQRFETDHQREFGFTQARPIECVNARVEAIVAGERPVPSKTIDNQPAIPLAPEAILHPSEFFSLGQRVSGPMIDWTYLQAGNVIDGPALIADSLTTTVVETGWQATVLSDRQLLLEMRSSTENARNLRDTEARQTQIPESPNPVLLEVFSNHFMSIARQMGLTLQRTSVSVNIKDRLDFSCAIFNSQGDLIVNAPHIPVHLGAMSETVRNIIASNPNAMPGDVFVTNDPYAGGSHLPDVTVVTPVFVEKSLSFWVASRGHHAEIGGKTPGSMPPDATCLADEGVLIQNLKLVSNGVEHFDQLESILRNAKYPSRNVADNLADIRAQIAANQIGVNQLLDLVARHSYDVVARYMTFLLDAAEAQVRDALKNLDDGHFEFEDAMDNGGTIRVAVEKREGEVVIDFSGTDPVSSDNLNANRAICIAATMYVMRCLLRSTLPLNQGVMRPVTLTLPECFLNPTPGNDAEHSPAIVGGNVETSQRVVDVLLGALNLAAASQGTMNNWLMGDSTFGYYETLGGGTGATETMDGADAVHSHMTNTRLTDPEILESRYPVRLVEFGIAPASGGAGVHAGGNGMIRSVEFLRPLTVSLLTSRRTSRPYGLKGGEAGASGQNLLRRANSECDVKLPSTAKVDVEVGDILKLITPGGGGWGTPPKDRN
ncbi:MAG: hydantoinase B/oxoprolinase family protein [Pirellulaceae bacterium]